MNLSHIVKNLKHKVMTLIGRGNYMFAGSELGRKSPIIYSLVAGCKLNGHDPFAYFNDVLKKISTWPADKIDELLPSNWKPPVSNAQEDNDIKDQMIKSPDSPFGLTVTVFCGSALRRNDTLLIRI